MENKEERSERTRFFCDFLEKELCNLAKQNDETKGLWCDGVIYEETIFDGDGVFALVKPVTAVYKAFLAKRGKRNTNCF